MRRHVKCCGFSIPFRNSFQFSRKFLSTRKRGRSQWCKHLFPHLSMLWQVKFHYQAYIIRVRLTSSERDEKSGGASSKTSNLTLRWESITVLKATNSKLNERKQIKWEYMDCGLFIFIPFNFHWIINLVGWSCEDVPILDNLFWILHYRLKKNGESIIPLFFLPHGCFLCPTSLISFSSL